MNLLTVPISSIEEGERFRKEYGDLEPLIDSIKRQGLIQPIAVMEKPDGGYLLLAGGRRFRAITIAELDEVPIRVFPSDITEFEQRSIELSENFHRKDLEWHEYTSLTTEIHTLQQAIHGEKISTLPDAPGWGLQQTAELLGRDKSGVAKDIKLQHVYEASPELFEKCKNKSDAVKVVQKEEERIIIEEMAKRAVKTSSSSKSRLMDCFVVRDFFEGVKQIPDSTMHLIEVDPPYAIDLTGTQKKRDDVTTSYNEVPANEYESFLRRLIAECWRTMADHSWLIFWYAQEPWQEVVYNLLTAQGFRGSRMFGAWIKGSGQNMQPNYNLSSTIECFYYMRKGDPGLAKPGRNNSFIYPAVLPSEKVHPTERPLALLSDILSTFAHPGSRVMVPCCGSGATLLAAHSLGMQPIGFELSKSFRDAFLVKVHKL